MCEFEHERIKERERERIRVEITCEGNARLNMRATKNYNVKSLFAFLLYDDYRISGVIRSTITIDTRGKVERDVVAFMFTADHYMNWTGQLGTSIM